MKNNEKIFVISLPRTGTSTICRMAKVCGLTPRHAPHVLLDHLINSDFNFFSDTPVFRPSVVEELCNNEKIIAKFIYINRAPQSIFDSWERVGLYGNYLNFIKDNQINNFDYQSYNEAFGNKQLNIDNCEEIINNHRDIVFNKIKTKEKELLVYSFDMGWAPFCNFLQVPIPDNVDIPILNKNKMFDVI